MPSDLGMRRPRRGPRSGRSRRCVRSGRRPGARWAQSRGAATPAPPPPTRQTPPCGPPRCPPPTPPTPASAPTRSARVCSARGGLVGPLACHRRRDPLTATARWRWVLGSSPAAPPSGTPPRWRPIVLADRSGPARPPPIRRRFPPDRGAPLASRQPNRRRGWPTRTRLSPPPHSHPQLAARTDPTRPPRCQRERRQPGTHPRRGTRPHSPIPRSPYHRPRPDPARLHRPRGRSPRPAMTPP
jgi:hypothetical protein